MKRAFDGWGWQSGDGGLNGACGVAENEEKLVKPLCQTGDEY